MTKKQYKLETDNANGGNPHNIIKTGVTLGGNLYVGRIR